MHMPQGFIPYTDFLTAVHVIAINHAVRVVFDYVTHSCHSKINTRTAGTIHCKNPCTKSQDMCTIVVYEGESEQCENDAHNRKIGEFNIDLASFDPPVTDPAKVGITVEFLLDCERALTVTANAVLDEKDRPQNKRSHRLKMERTADLTLTETEVRRMKRLELYVMFEREVREI